MVIIEFYNSLTDEKMTNATFPETGFVRLHQIIGNPNANPPIPAIIPVSNSTWWEGIKSGRYPKPVKLSPRTTAWRVEDIRELLEQLSQQAR
jgi:prophage regulatory protein